MGLVAPWQWDLYISGTEPMFPALAGRFFTTEPPGKPSFVHFLLELKYYYTDFYVTEIKGICVTEINGNYIEPQVFVIPLSFPFSLFQPHFSTYEVSQKEKHQYSILTHIYGI